MSWLRIDDKFARHPKVLNLSDKAFRLHVAALCTCAEMLSDGRLGERDIKMLVPVVNASSWKRYVNELVSAGLWTVEIHGWSINDYLDYNPAAVKVKEQRKRNAERQRNHRRNAVTNAVTNAVPSRPVFENPLASGLTDAEQLVETARRAALRSVN